MSELSISLPKENRYSQIIVATILGIILTSISYLVGFGLGFINKVNYLEVFAVFTSYASTYLCVVEKRFNYVYGFISSAAYAVLFYQSGLFASALLNLYLTPSLLYGYFRWGKDSNTRKIQWLPIRWYPVYIAVTAAAFFGAYYLMSYFGTPMIWTDGMVLVLTILAQFLLDNKRPENWIVWFAVNVFAIYTYFTSGLFLAGVQYILFLMNTILGFIVWIKRMKNA